jgi:ferritin-like protein
MTPLELLFDEAFVAYRTAHWYTLAEYERKAKAEIKAMAEVARRGLGQQFRWAAKRIKESMQ